MSKKFLYKGGIMPQWVDCYDGDNYPPEGMLVPVRFTSLYQMGEEIKTYATWTNLMFTAEELSSLYETDQTAFYAAMKNTIWESINGTTLESVNAWLYAGE